MRALLAVAALGTLTSLLASGVDQQSQAPVRDVTRVATPGTARIRGRVTAVENGAPLRRADIQMSSPGGPTPLDAPVVTTDDQGYFEFKSLRAGRYTLYASKSGYMTLAHGQRRPAELVRPVDLAEGQFLDGVNFALPRGAVIVVRVTDEFGDPVSGLSVTPLQYQFVNGERRLGSGGVSPMSLVSGTDDLGEQRLFGLAPGEYYINAGGRATGALGPAGPGLMYAPTFYPGTASVAEAQRVKVAVGQELRVTLPLVSARAVRIRGTVRSSTGAPLIRPSMELQSIPGFSGLGSPPAFTIQADGSFISSPVFPGTYQLNVNPALGDAGSGQEFARLPLTVGDRDVNDLSIATSRAATLRGRVVFDGGASPDSVRSGSALFAIAFPTDERGSIGGRSTWNTDGTFEVPGMVGGGGQVRVSTLLTNAGWVLKAVLLQGTDISDTPLNFEPGRDVDGLQVVLTQTRTDVSGTAADAQSVPVPDYAALIFPEDRRQWTALSRRIAASRPDQRGQFKIAGLPPGRYQAVALDYLPMGEERNPELLERVFEKAIRFELGEGEAKALTLPLVNY